MATDQEIAALREDIAQGRPWIPDGWRILDTGDAEWPQFQCPNADLCAYVAVDLAIAAMLEWGGSDRLYWYLLSKRTTGDDWVATLRDCDTDSYHDATNPALYLAMRAACLAAIGAQDAPCYDCDCEAPRP